MWCGLLWLVRSDFNELFDWHYINLSSLWRTDDLFLLSIPVFTFCSISSDLCLILFVARASKILVDLKLDWEKLDYDYSWQWVCDELLESPLYSRFVASFEHFLWLCVGFVVIQLHWTWVHVFHSWGWLTTIDFWFFLLCLWSLSLDPELPPFCMILGIYTFLLALADDSEFCDCVDPRNYEFGMNEFYF